MSDSALIFRLGTDGHVVVVFGRISVVTIDVREAGESTDAIGMSQEASAIIVANLAFRIISQFMKHVGSSVAAKSASIAPKVKILLRNVCQILCR